MAIRPCADETGQVGEVQQHRSAEPQNHVVLQCSVVVSRILDVKRKRSLRLAYVAQSHAPGSQWLILDILVATSIESGLLIGALLFPILGSVVCLFSMPPSDFLAQFPTTFDGQPEDKAVFSN